MTGKSVGYYVITATEFKGAQPIDSKDHVEAARVAVARDGVTVGVLAVVPVDAVKFYDVAGEMSLRLTLRPAP